MNNEQNMVEDDIREITKIHENAKQELDKLINKSVNIIFELFKLRNNQKNVDLAFELVTTLINVHETTRVVGLTHNDLDELMEMQKEEMERASTH